METSLLVFRSIRKLYNPKTINPDKKLIKMLLPIVIDLDKSMYWKGISTTSHHHEVIQHNENMISVRRRMCLIISYLLKG